MTGWRELAACKGMQDVFFNPRHETLAKKVCAGCPVKAACLEDGADDHELIRGGLTPEERHLAPRRPGPRLQPCGTDAAYHRHLDRGEPVDALCREAHTTAMRLARWANPDAQRARQKRRYRTQRAVRAAAQMAQPTDGEVA